VNSSGFTQRASRYNAAVDRIQVFNQHRPLLFSIAYRMLGSAMDAEDMVQESFLRWQRAADQDVRSPKSYLAASVTRLCIDYLESARVRRETYVGPWLPEPLVTEPAPDAAESTLLAESLSMAFLVVLESLSPIERAAFLLREVFDYAYVEIAEIVGKSEANCRQLLKRAKDHIAARRPRFDAPPEVREQILYQFLQTCGTGDMDGLLALLSEDVVLYSDGGGKTPAALKPIFGADKVTRYLFGVLRKLPAGFQPALANVNGQLSLVGYADGKPYSVLVLDVANGRIDSIFNILNPDKLRGISPLTDA
jgi:RNA polymerase sigma-70 factor (ECF subfamily)